MNRFRFMIHDLGFKKSFSLYFLVILGLFFYSYTQVDLSLTLSRISLWQTIEKSFQYIGYFNRPLSTYLYLGILLLLFGFYVYFLKLVEKSKLKRQYIWLIIFTLSVILTFSYNAFSYDIFNNIFDAKIFTHYQLNPYAYKALDFPHDPMLSFMHWTQRTYPYGPFWLLFSVPLSYFGLQIFLVTFFLFKILATVSFLGAAYFVEKITHKINPKTSLFSLILFALNPLVIIESLVSAHNDITMFFLALWSIWLLIDNKSVRSILLLILSVGVKFTTIFLAPIYLYVFISNKLKKKINWNIMFFLFSTFMIIPIFIASFRTNFQPWYLLYFICFAVLPKARYFTVIPIIVMSLFGLLEYVPFLYQGDWNAPIPTILNILTDAGISVSLLLILVIFLHMKFSTTDKG